jgi:AraC-like DNA-binding protein
VILNLNRDYLFDCPEGAPAQRMPAALIVGARSIYEIIDSSDMADLVGIVFEPGGFGAFAGDAVDLFSNRSVSLEDVWGTSARTLRDRLREIRGGRQRLCCLEEFLIRRFSTRLSRNSMVEFALGRFNTSASIATVREMAISTGLSERRFSQIFREDVGLTPKVWCRIQRFQRTVRLLHSGVDIPWSELALDCGFYDQSHFANEFRAFSGIDATSYSALRTQWANHVLAD